MKLNLETILALGAGGAYDVTAELCGNSAAVILSVIEWLGVHERWEGVGHFLTDEETDTIDAMLAQLLDEVMTNVAENGGNGVVSVVTLLDRKSQNTPGGTFTSGARRTRALNRESDPGEICSLVADEFVLAAGAYLVLWSAPAHRVGFNQTWLYNVTGDEDLIIGSSEMANIDAGATSIHSIGVGIIDVAAAQTLRIEHRSSHTFATRGFGAEADLDEETYTQVVIIGLE